MITYKGNIFFPVGGVENASLNRVPWGIWWGGQILDLWWRRGGLFVKEAFSGLSSQTTAKILTEWKVYLRTVMEEKKTASYERPRRVTWAWCVTRRSSNCCVGSAFGKCALTTADGRIFFMSTEKRAPWPRSSCRCIGGGVIFVFFGGRCQ